MTATVPLTGFTPARQLPNGELFYSPRGLFEFQIDGLAEAYVRTADGDGGVLAVWDTGIGKTVFGIVLAAYLFADDEIDQVIVVCERNKRHDWVEEFERFTALDAHLYHGQGRQRRLLKAGNPHVLVTTYETGRSELMTRVKAEGARGKGTCADGPLVEALGLRGKRILWVFDESTKMRNRTSEIHKAFDYILRQLRKGPFHQRVLGLTATPMERGYEDAYNLGRIITPSAMPTVATFEKVFTLGQDRFFNLIFREDRADQFALLFQDTIIRKRKTDSDVIDQFPKISEKSIVVEMGPDEAAFADAVQEMLDAERPAYEAWEGAQAAHDTLTWAVMRMTAAHPAAHLHASNRISKAIAKELGPETLRAIGSAKTHELIERLRPLVKGQGAQAVVFSFFSSAIPEIARELRAAGITVAEYHGGHSDDRNEEAKRDFIAGKYEVLFCSDMGAKGLNLQNAEYVVEYESALTYANRTQRLNRVHRIVSDKPSVTCMTLVLHNTVEQNILAKVIDRNEGQDQLLGDEEDGSGFIGAATRREMLAAYRRTRKRSA